MTDIVERLRKRMVRRELGDDPLVKVFGDAADEIERLRAALTLLLDFHNEGRIPTSKALAQAEAALGEDK